MRYQPSGSFELDLPVAKAIGLFTPEGERDWVPGWDPRYPAGDASEAPDTVFTTDSDGVVTTWLIVAIDRTGSTASYVRLTPGLHAGAVHVSVKGLSADRCQVDVAYDMTQLATAPADALGAYDPATFSVVMQEWESLIRAYLDRRR